MVCAPTELQQNTPARAVNELHRAGAPLFYKENAQSGDFRQYRTILSAAAAGAVLKPLGGNCAVLPKIKTNRPEPACTIAVPGFGPVCLLVTTHSMRQSSQGTLHAAKS